DQLLGQIDDAHEERHSIDRTMRLAAPTLNGHERQALAGVLRRFQELPIHGELLRFKHAWVAQRILEKDTGTQHILFLQLDLGRLTSDERRSRLYDETLGWVADQVQDDDILICVDHDLDWLRKKMQSVSGVVDLV